MEEFGDYNEDSTINIGTQIRVMRNQRRLSQLELATKSGISRNTLSLIERGHTSPTVSTLKSIAHALSVDINAFFQPFDESRTVFTKANHRPHLQLSHGVLADLGLGMFENMVTPLLLQLDPNARSGSALTHEGQDFIFCLEGEILYSVNGRSYVLEPGDSLFFDGVLPHRFSNISTESARLLIILSSPHDSAQYITGHFTQHAATGGQK